MTKATDSAKNIGDKPALETEITDAMLLAGEQALIDALGQYLDERVGDARLARAVSQVFAAMLQREDIQDAPEPLPPTPVTGGVGVKDKPHGFGSFCF